MHRLTIATPILAGLLLAHAAASSAVPGPFPVTPDPAACRVAPRPLTFWQRLVGLRAADLAQLSTPANPTSSIAAAPTEADGELTRAITASVREELACLNAGDARRHAALSTDARLLHAIAHRAHHGVAITDEQVARLAEPAVPLAEEQRAVLHDVRDVRLLADGRVSALIEVANCCDQRPGRRIYHSVFAEADGRWLVDERFLSAPRELTPQ